MYYTLAADGIEKPFEVKLTGLLTPVFQTREMAAAAASSAGRCPSQRLEGGRRLRRMGHCSRIEHSPYPLKGRHARGRSWLVVRVDWQCRTTASGQGEEEYSTFVPLPSGATKCARARQTLFSQKGSCSLPFQLTNLSLCRLSGHLVSLSLFHFVSII